MKCTYVDSLLRFVYDRDLDLRALQGDYGTGGPAHVSGSKTAYFLNHVGGKIGAKLV